MQVNWDYSALAASYGKRPSYAFEGIQRMIGAMGLLKDAHVCDVGAGTGHLTVELLKFPFNVTAVEPNDAMRAIGMERTRGASKLRWIEGTGESTGLPAKTFDLVTFGSSFNVVDRAKALAEANRVLRPRGWFACLWNHRVLSDPLQTRIEEAIRKEVEGYDYGLRRQDQREFLEQSGMFEEVFSETSRVMHRQSVKDCYEAWKSHATLQRQAGERFESVLKAIRSVLPADDRHEIEIPYDTRIWFARFK